MATKQKILEIAEDARSQLDTSYGQCHPASKSLKKKLAEKTEANKDDIEIEEVRMNRSQTIRHYVVAYPTKNIDDVDAYGRVLIDITLDQYCTKFEEQGKVETSIGPKDNIPNVNFYESKEVSPYF